MVSKQQTGLAGVILFLALCFLAGVSFGILFNPKPPESKAPYIGKFDISDFELLRAKHGADRYVVDSRTGQFIMLDAEGKEIVRLDWTEK